MKKLILAIIICFAISGVAGASPLTDYSEGKASFDINWRPDLKMNNAWGNGEESGNDRGDGYKSNVDFMLTVGLGHKLAFQYGVYNPKASPEPTYRFGANTQEFNLLYQLNNHLSAFVGLHSAKYTRPFGTPDAETKFHGGLIGYTKLDPKTTAYGVVGLGSNVENYEVGLSYEFAKKFEFNLSYRYKKVKGLDSGFGNWEDVTAKGLGYGVTYKF